MSVSLLIKTCLARIEGRRLRSRVQAVQVQEMDVTRKGKGGLTDTLDLPALSLTTSDR
jgi:hypothetical protein